MQNQGVRVDPDDPVTIFEGKSSWGDADECSDDQEKAAKAMSEKRVFPGDPTVSTWFDVPETTASEDRLGVGTMIITGCALSMAAVIVWALVSITIG